MILFDCQSVVDDKKIKNSCHSFNRRLNRQSTDINKYYSLSLSPQMLILLYSDTNYVLDGFRAEYFISNW